VYASDQTLNFTLWDNILKTNVQWDQQLEGIIVSTVNYDAISKDPTFQTVLNQIATANLTGLNKTQFYAFYINTYNVLAVHMIIKHACKEDIFGTCGTIKSIRDLTTWIPPKAVWDQDAGTVAGQTQSLGQVEDLLRNPPSPWTEDSRLHAAIVCASISCPNLRNRSYTVENLNSELEDNWNDFMSNNKKGMDVDQQSNSVTLSSIFDWFDGDFTSNGTNKIQFIASHLYDSNPNKVFLQKNAQSITISYFDYNWDVNANGDLPCDSKSRPCYQLWALVLTLTMLVIISAIVLIVVAVRRYKNKKRSGYHPLN